MFAFLRAELAPSPARWRDALRLTLLCAIATTLVMAFHIPYGEFLIIFFFAVSQRDAWASFRKARLRGIGTILGGAFAIVVIVACADKPWLFFVVQGLIFAAGLFLMRTTTIPYAVLLAMFTFAIAVPPEAIDPEASLETVLWRILLTVSGAVLGTVAQLVLWPEHPERLLLRKLGARLRVAESILARVVKGRVSPRDSDNTSPSARAVLSSAMASQLDLLASAEAGSRWLRQRHAEQAKLISDVEMVLVAAFRLEELAAESQSVVGTTSIFSNLQELREDLARLGRALEEGRPATPVSSGGEEASAVPAPDGARASAVLAAIRDLRRLVRQMPASMAFLAVPDASWLAGRRSFDAVREPIAGRTIFTPACRLSNGEAMRFALKGSLAASICYVIYQALDWPGISTCVVTCLITAQSSFGAGLQKSLLRLAGAIVGAVVSVAVIVVLWPNMDSLASFVVVTTILFFGASWINAGSSRISYVGLQTGLVLALVLVNSPGQAASLAPAGDRILGVLLGISVMGIVDFTLWPSFAGAALRRKLADILRELAAIPRCPSRNNWDQAQESAFGIHREIAAALSLYSESQFEIISRRADAGADRQRLLSVINAVGEVFLALLRAMRHRKILERQAAPDGWRERIQNLDEAVAQRLETLAGWFALSTTTVVPAPGGLSLEWQCDQASVSSDAGPLLPSPFDDYGLVCHELIEALERLESTVIAVGRVALAEDGVGLAATATRPA